MPINVCCCEQVEKLGCGGPILVKAGWYHFLVLSSGGCVHTFIGSPQLAYTETVLESEKKYWKPSWGNGESVDSEIDFSIWPTQGSFSKTTKALDGDRRYHPWTYADCSYDIASKGFDQDCPEKTITSFDSKIETHGIIFHNYPKTDFNNLQPPGSCDYENENPECNQKCTYKPIGFHSYRSASPDDDSAIARPWYLEPYLKFDGTSEGTGVTLYEAEGKGLPKLINAYSPAQLAPSGHPLETPTILLGVKDIECGAYHNLVRLSNDSIMAWGLNSMGQCNVPDSLLPDELRPAGVKPHPNRQNICSLHAGFSTSAVMFNDGTVLCWGDPEVADKVNKWKHLRTSLIKTSDSGSQQCCIGAPSIGFPECLPGTDCSKPENWVPENKYNLGRYNANNDWEGYWHNGASPAYPHFDLGVETKYVYPVNFGHVVKLSSQDLGNHASSEGLAGPPIPGDTDESEVDVPQYSYRYAQKWSSHNGVSRCAAKGEIKTDFAVGMLRTGQILTTRTENSVDKSEEHCRDCEQDVHLTRSDGTIVPSNKGPATNLGTWWYCTNGQSDDGFCRNNLITTIDCDKLLTVDTSIVVKCDNFVCESKKRWYFDETAATCDASTACGDQAGGIPPLDDDRNLCLSARRPEGIGCFSSTDNERGYDPNWQGETLYLSAGHVRGYGRSNQPVNNGTHPVWNKQQADYGWASLPTPQDRFKPQTKPINVHPLCRAAGTYITACTNYFDTNAECGSECPENNTNGNRSATPGLNGQGDLPGSVGFFHYPEHMHSFGCVAGTNTVTWLGPQTLLNKTLTDLLFFPNSNATNTNQNGDVKRADKSSSAMLSYTQNVFRNSYNSDVCPGCNHVGSHIAQEYNICSLSHGVIHGNRNPDPDGMINPLSGKCNCVPLSTCAPPTLLDTITREAAIKPSRPWGPWQIAQNLGVVPSPPIMEYGNFFDKSRGTPLWTLGMPTILWTKKEDGKDDGRIQDTENFFVTNNGIGTIAYAEALSSPEWFTAYDIKLDWPEILRKPAGSSRMWSLPCDCANICWADDELNGQGTGIGGDGLGCAAGGNLAGDEQDTCSGTYYYDCSNSPKKYNPNGKALQKTGSGFTLYSNFPSSFYTRLQAFSPDKTKVVTISNAITGSLKIELWNISNNHTPLNVLIKSITLPTRSNSTTDAFGLSDPISLNWMKDNTLVVGLAGGNGIINYIEITGIATLTSNNPVISYKPIKFLTNKWSATNISLWSEFSSVEINKAFNKPEILNRCAVDDRSGKNYIALHQESTIDPKLNLVVSVYQPCNDGLCPEGTINIPDAVPYNKNLYKYYIKSGNVSIYEALTPARKNALDFIRGITTSVVPDTQPDACTNPNNSLAPCWDQAACIPTDNGGIHPGDFDQGNPTDPEVESCPWEFDEPANWVYGGHVDRIAFTGTGDLVLNSNDLYTTVYWGFVNNIPNQTPETEKLLLKLNYNRYTQTAKYETAPVPVGDETTTAAEALYKAESLLQGLRNNHIYVNDDSSKVGIVGWWDGDPITGFIDPSLPTEYWYSTAVATYDLQWGSVSNSKYNPGNQNELILINGDGFGNSKTGIGNEQLPINSWHQIQESFVKFDNNLKYAIIGKFRDNDTRLVQEFNTVNISEKTFKRYGNVFGDDYDSRPNYSSFGALSNNTFFITTNAVNRSPTDATKIPNGIIIDGNIDYTTNSLALWNRRICGLRSCLGSPPFKGWTGGGNFGCADVFGFDNSPGINEAKTGFLIRDPTKGVNDLLCPNCDKTSDDGYSRWGMTHPTISFASGRSWSVHLRNLPWYRDTSRGSIFYKKHHCEETDEYGLSEYFDSGGFTKQKSMNHVTKNYNDIVIWVTGNMIDPCPPWPLATWNPGNGIDDIDIELPQPSTKTENIIVGSSNIGPDGLTYDEGTSLDISVRHCGKYPSWVPVPNKSATATDKMPERSYKGIWRNGTWNSGLYGITNGFVNGLYVPDAGISAQNISDIIKITNAVGVTAAYQSSCVTCEKAWTEPLPPSSDIVGKKFFRQGVGMPWASTDASGCSKLKLGACCKQDLFGITQCFYGTDIACAYTGGDVLMSWGFTAGVFHENVKCDEITCI